MKYVKRCIKTGMNTKAKDTMLRVKKSVLARKTSMKFLSSERMYIYDYNTTSWLLLPFNNHELYFEVYSLSKPMYFSEKLRTKKGKDPNM